jgi:hypothetical protein
MKPTSHKRQIRVAILAFFGTLRPGDIYHGSDVVRYCKRYINGIKNTQPDTILRHQRELRQEQMINYDAVYKMDGKYKVLRPGEPHSR